MRGRPGHPYIESATALSDRSSSADIVCTNIENTGDHWNRTHLIFLESNGHGSLNNSSSRKQCL